MGLFTKKGITKAKIDGDVIQIALGKGGSGGRDNYDGSELKLPIKNNASDSAPTSITYRLIMMNDGVNLCATACAACWDTKLPAQYADRSKYVGKRTKIGHTSVIEHSNVAFYLWIPSAFSEDLIKFLSVNNFLHTCVKQSEFGDGYHMLIGGSWRAFADLYLWIDTIAENAVMRAVTECVYQYIPSDAMLNIIGMGILDEKNFANLEVNNIIEFFNSAKNHRIDDNMEILSADNISSMAITIADCCAHHEAYLFTYKDLLKFCTVSVEFNHMSRIITQQLTRHRNGITQESQRYVDYSVAPFNSPATFKPEKYDAKALYDVEFGGKKFRMNLQNLGNAMNAIYGQLTDKLKNGTNALMKEDARAFLTNNTQCGRIFITFNFYNMIKFLELREDPHAQAEINKVYGIVLGDWFRCFFLGKDKTDLNLYDALNPVMKDTSFYNTPIFTKDEAKIIGRANEVSETLSQEELNDMMEKSIQIQDENPEDTDAE